MKTLPVLDMALLAENGAGRKQFLESLESACSGNGFFYLINHGIPESLCSAVLRESNHFFDLDHAAKNGMHIRHSGHFRGYSEMKNERDWREQVHFGQELREVALPEAPCDQLVGPNQWPGELGESFKSSMLDYLAAAGKLGEQLLAAMAEILGWKADHFKTSDGEPAYLLMKLICYYPQPNVDVDRPGVAPHCDWSWLTILLQDEVGGLEVLAESGEWVAAPPAKNMLSVNLGELLEIVTKGHFVATPHQVVNPSEQKRRISVPVFINPALQDTVEKGSTGSALDKGTAHVHRVVPSGTFTRDFNFGASEWERKGLGKWCYNADCLSS